MLVLTQQATDIIRALNHQANAPDSAGLRIASTMDGSESFSVSRAEAPFEGDQVVGEQGALVFVDPGAAMILDDMVLDAQVEGEGVVRFELQPQ